MKLFRFYTSISVNTIITTDSKIVYQYLEPSYKKSIEGTKVYNIEDIQRIEIWKYPPIPMEEEFVDKLSLYLTLKDDVDPRVEKELEIMINKMPW